MGPIAGQRISAQIKLEILTVIATSLQQGVSVRRSCSILVIAQRRVVRWQQQARRDLSLADRTPGPKAALHRMLPEEIAQIVALAGSESYADLSHRMLAVTAWDQGLFTASFSTVYRVLKERNLMGARAPGGAHNGNSKAPVRKDLSGPNQRWCWDISYLLTFQKGVYLYLYLLLDEWSRKAVQWRVSWHQTAEESRRLLEGGLLEQNILDLPEAQRPELINDRGRQMKAKPIRQLCEDHQMPHLFARPRTPSVPKRSKSALGVLRSLTGLLEAVLLAFLAAGITSEEAGLLQEAALLGIQLDERAGDAHPQCAGLAADTTTEDGAIDVVDLFLAGEAQRLADDHPRHRRGEVVLEGATVDGHDAGARAETDARDRFLATSGGLGKRLGAHAIHIPR